MRRATRAAAVAAFLALPELARAHHGVAGISVAGPEGPGAPMETTSALPLPQGTLFTMVKTEYASFQRVALAEPHQKSYASFNMIALGYGVRPWMSLFVLQPFNVKEQDGVGTNAGAGDTSLMFSLALKWDEGLQLAPEKESLDDLMDWHLGVAVSSSLPVGATTARGAAGAYLAPDMQTGFGAPSATLGVAVMKQLTRELTWFAEASYQHFFPHTYPLTRYQFGGESRLNTAVACRVYGAGRFRLDVAGELNGLRLERDRQRSGAAGMAPLRASGGEVLYAGVGVRAYAGPLSVSLGAKRSALRSLNEAAEQQGSEGLERLRAALTVSYSTRI